jgi:hypothetical protein
MPFERGQSGNPAGRPKGTTRASKLVALLEPHAPALVEKVTELALSGDTKALRLCLERLYPSLKARDEAIEISNLRSEDSLVDQSNAIVDALASGELTITESATAMQTIAAQSRIIEAQELESRIAALEGKLNSSQN